MPLNLFSYIDDSIFPIRIDQHNSLAETRNVTNKNFENLLKIFTNLKMTDLDPNITSPTNNARYILKYTTANGYQFILYTDPTLTTDLASLTDVELPPIPIPLDNLVFKYNSGSSKFVLQKQMINQDEIPRGTQYIFEDEICKVPSNAQYIVSLGLQLLGTSKMELPGNAVLVLI
jgi:hypothetical protein